MRYSLGIDVGATTCAAALCRGSAVEPCALSGDGPTMPAVALPRPDGTVIVGHEADRLSTYEPGPIARMVAAGLLDDEPVVIDGQACHPFPLTVALIDAVVRRATADAGAPPERVLVTYPLRDDGGPERLLAEAAHNVAGGAAVVLPAPIAAAAKLARDRDLGPDSLVAVVDFGGASLDVTLVRCTPQVFDLVGDPASLTDVGGVDLDAAVVTLAESAIGDVTSTVAPDDTVSMLALRRMRASCRAAKERLSADEAAIVDVALPRARAQVEITRAAFERAVERMLDDAVDLVLSTIDGAGLIPADVDTLLLVGGSARIPRFRRLVAERTGIAVVVDDEPELTVALGASLFGDVADVMPGVPHVPTPAPARTEPSAADGPGPGGPFLDSPFLAGLPDLDGTPTGEVPAVSPDMRLAAAPPPADAPADRPMPVPPLRTGEVWPAALDAGWSDDGPGGGAGPADEWPAPGGDWQDARTSVFDPAPPSDEFRLLTTSAGAPFGSRSGQFSRLRERDEVLDDEPVDGGPSFDLRLVAGGAAAAVFLVVLAAFAVLSGTGGGPDPIAVADTVPTTTPTTERSNAGTVALAATSTTTTSTSTTTTTEPDDPEPTRPLPTDPPPTIVTPPPTAPPTTPRPTTTTTRPRPTTTTTTTTTTTLPCTTTTLPGEECPDTAG